MSYFKGYDEAIFSGSLRKATRILWNVTRILMTAQVEVESKNKDFT